MKLRMTTDPIPNCPQPETPIRERAWTPEQLERRAKRLDELSDAVANGLRNEFTMRVPAEPDRDADLVLQDTARIVRAYADTLSKPADSGRVTDEVVAGALFDLMGFLTSRDEVTTLSGRHEASPAVDALRAFAAMRGLQLDEANVKGWQAALAAQGQGENAHPDDAAVDAFAATMKEKLATARAKGRGGWQDKDDCPQQRLSNMLRAHIEKGDPRDVANFCMFLHQRGEAILPAPPALPAELAAEYTRGRSDGWDAAKAASPAGVPDGWALVPRALTAENGAKAALMGEFEIMCPSMCGECTGDGCAKCNQTGVADRTISVNWTTIKAIYAAAINHFVAAQQPGESHE